MIPNGYRDKICVFRRTAAELVNRPVASESAYPFPYIMCSVSIYGMWHRNSIFGELLLQNLRIIKF